MRINAAISMVTRLVKYLEREVSIKRIMLPEDCKGRIIATKDSPSVLDLMEAQALLDYFKYLVEYKSEPVEERRYVDQKVFDWYDMRS